VLNPTVLICPAKVAVAVPDTVEAFPSDKLFEPEAVTGVVYVVDVELAEI
jgi:hypothetical protein